MNDAQAGLSRDPWTSGESYEAYVGRWSRQVAERFITWLEIAPGRDWLDIGCGTGAVTRAIVMTHEPTRVFAFDRSDAFLQFARAATNDERVSFQSGDAQELPFGADGFDVAVSGLVLNFVSEPERMVREMARVVRPGGVVALYVWDYAGEMQMMRHFWDAVRATDPASDLDEGRRFPIANLTALRELFDRVGLRQIDTDIIDIPTVFVNFDDYWRPFLGGTGSAPVYVQSLSDAARLDLREALRERLPVGTDGTISLIARALAIRASVA
ncbi:MAG: methyltransferase domain-containing protein [Chloroflexota bacterium]|nr:methyltransferase domain-containing protein [Chloroflexota bacterium]